MNIWASKITVYRSPEDTSIDNNSYEGLSPPISSFNVIIANVSASIQNTTRLSVPGTKFPQDSSYDTGWNIFPAIFSVPKGMIQVRDFIIDDLGREFEVITDYWNLLAYKLFVKRLTT
jgi:hypothetical protein